MTTTPNARVILPADATEEMMLAGMASAERMATATQGDAIIDGYSSMVSASPSSGRVTAEMLEASARAILKAAWEITGETPEDAALIADSIIDGIADDYEDDVLAARMAARAAFEAIGLTVEG